MTRNSDFTQPPELRGGLFRAAAHVVIVPSGSVVAILDLEHGTHYATTPFGADAWAVLVEGRRADNWMDGKPCGDPAPGERAEVLARVAGYLLDRQLIEPRLGADGGRLGTDGGRG